MSNLFLFDSVGQSSTTIAPAPAFRRDGKVYRTDDGKIFPWLFGSAFPLVRWVMDKNPIVEPMLAELYAVGQRGVRPFLTSEINGALLGDGGPYSDQEILDAVGPFCDTMRVKGFNVDLSVFQAVKVTMPQVARQHRFWNSVLDIAKVRPWTTVSASQEWPKQINALDYDHLRRPTDQSWDGGGIMDGVNEGVQVASGIWVPPMRGTHDAYEADRGPEWMRKQKSNLDISQATGIGCVGIEPMGMDETDQSGKRSNNPDYFFWNAAVGRLMALGTYAHPQAGVMGTMLGPVQKQCMASHYLALSLIPLECQLGQYAKAVGASVRSYDDVGGGSLRTYGMRMHGNEEWTVVVKPGPSYPRNGGMVDPIVESGWTAKQRLGVEGTIIQTMR